MRAEGAQIKHLPHAKNLGLTPKTTIISCRYPLQVRPKTATQWVFAAITVSSEMLPGFASPAPGKTRRTNFASTGGKLNSSTPVGEFAGALAIVLHSTPSEDASTAYEKESRFPRSTLIVPNVAVAARATVSFAAGSAAVHAVAGLPSMAATAGDPGTDDVTEICWQRTRSSVGCRSGRRVGMTSGVPSCAVFAPRGVMSGIAAPEL